MSNGLGSVKKTTKCTRLMLNTTQQEKYYIREKLLKIFFNVYISWVLFILANGETVFLVESECVKMIKIVFDPRFSCLKCSQHQEWLILNIVPFSFLIPWFSIFAACKSFRTQETLFPNEKIQRNFWNWQINKENTFIELRALAFHGRNFKTKIKRKY